MTTTETEQSLNVSDKTAKRTMAELKAIELVSLGEVESDHGGSAELQIKLFEQFRWFLSPEFKEIRSNYEWKNFFPHIPNENTIQNCIVQEKGWLRIFQVKSIHSIAIIARKSLME